MFRGIAILAMIVYHCCFDLAQYGWLVADFNNDWRWIWFRIPILSSFLFVAGASLALAEARGQTAAQFWRHAGLIAGAAALVTAGSYAMFPQSYIYFGVLHAIVVMGVLARPALRAGAWLIVAGLAVLALGATIRHPFFDQPLWHWVGMMTFKPRTEDYVPLFPWFGMLLLGAGAAAWRVRRDARSDRLRSWVPPAGATWITWLGRHSLAVYMVHQPLLLGTMELVRRLT